MDDQAIIDLYWDRSEEAIVQTDKKYGKYCFTIANRILENPDDSEECVSDTYMSAWNRMPPVRPQILSVFLGKITRNISVSRWRKQSAVKRGAGGAGSLHALFLGRDPGDGAERAGSAATGLLRRTANSGADRISETLLVCGIPGGNRRGNGPEPVRGQVQSVQVPEKAGGRFEKGGPL